MPVRFTVRVVLCVNVFNFDGVRDVLNTFSKLTAVLSDVFVDFLSMAALVIY